MFLTEEKLGYRLVPLSTFKLALLLLLSSDMNEDCKASALPPCWFLIWRRTFPRLVDSIPHCEHIQRLFFMIFYPEHAESLSAEELLLGAVGSHSIDAFKPYTNFSFNYFD